MEQECTLCPHKCKIDRNINIGRCKAGNKIEIGGVSLHKFEEPCISGKNGSGTVFFSKCNLNCVFCQNYEISNLGNGRKIEIEELSKILLKQQENGAENIKLYRANSEGKIVEDETHLINNSLNYEGEKETNLDELKISNQGSIILIRSVNQNVCEVRNNDESIIHDGTLLAKGNVVPEDLEYTLSFDIIIETNRNIKYKGTVSIQLPTGDIETEGKGRLEKTDFSDVIFKRM